VSAFLRDDTGQDTLPATIVSIQTAGEFLNWHPHLHVLAPAGAFRTDGSFVHSPVFDTGILPPGDTRPSMAVVRKIQSPHRTARRPPETPRPVAAAFQRLLPRPVPKDLRSTVRQPGTGLLPSSPSASTFDVRGCFGLKTIRSRVY
jgi:hypothetical protein